MRLARLDLTRYGRFTDRSLTFPRPAPDAPDLHIVYGANEAGKSTAFAAWLDLLFGIPLQSPHAFLHSYDAMRIAAVMDHDGREVALTRIKRQKNSLLDGSGAPVPGDVVSGLTGGIDRDGYRAMFSLDRATLERGGKDILDSKGNLGELLFSASAGLAGLAELLAGLQRTADDFHPARREDHSLAKAKAALAMLAERRRALDTDAAAYRVLREAVASAERHHAETSLAHARAVTEHEVARRTLAALPHLARLTEAEARLADLPDLPPPPEGWAEELSGLVRAEATARALIGSNDDQAEKLRRIRDGEQPDPGALDIAADMRAAGALMSAHAEAVKDLPTRREEAARQDRALAEAARALGQPDRPAAALLLPADRLAALREVVAARREAVFSLRSARDEAQAAEDASAAALALLPAHGGDDETTAALALLLDRLRERDAGQALRLATAAAEGTKAALDRCLAALHPYPGDAAALAALVPPTPAMLAALSSRIAAAATGLAAAAAEARQGAAAVARQEAELAALTLRSGEAEAAELRTLREALWATHRAHLSPETADAFEAAMRRDDLATADLAERKTETALHRGKAADLALTRAAAARADTAWLDARREAAAAQAALDAVRQALSPDLPGAMDVAGLRDWLALRDAALKAAAEHEESGRALARARADHAEAAAALAGLLRDAGAGQPYDTLLAVADARVRDATRTAALREAAGRAAAEADRRRAQLGRAAHHATALDLDWARLCADTWIDPATDPDAAATLLDALAPLDGLVTRREELRHRIAAMETNVAAFAAAVAPLAARLGVDRSDPARAWEAVRQRVEAAEKARDIRQQAEAGLADLAASRRDLDREASRISGRLAEMAGHFGSADPSRVGTLLQQAKDRAALLRDALEAGLAVSRALELPLAEARAAAEAADRTALELADAEMMGRLADLDAARQDSHANLRAARAALDAAGGDDAVARLDTDIRTRTIELRDRAEAHLRLRFGLMTLHHALQSYRETHRSTMLARASDAFAAITDGAYTGLAVQPDKDGERLVALPAGGGSRQAHQMSAGTETQLYLALRMAGFHEYAASRATVPFIADDIMETFDDTRAARTFARLAEMAAVGQVIYLTHHRHLCEIARDACPAAQLHRLD